MSGPDDSAVRFMAVLWAEVVRRQISRYEEAVDGLAAAAADAQFREVYEANPMPEWRSAYDEADFVLTRSETWVVGAERYFLLQALAQLRKCVVTLPGDNLPVLRHQKVIRLLRDIDEHWEQPVGRSLIELRGTRPEVGPGQVRFDGTRTWIGQLTTSELLEWADDVGRVARQRSAADGNPIPPADGPA